MASPAAAATGTPIKQPPVTRQLSAYGHTPFDEAAGETEEAVGETPAGNKVELIRSKIPERDRSCLSNVCSANMKSACWVVALAISAIILTVIIKSYDSPQTVIYIVSSAVAAVALICFAMATAKHCKKIA